VTETAWAEGGDINCANPGSSAAKLRIDRPLAFPCPELPEVDELPTPAGPAGWCRLVVWQAAVDPVAVATLAVTAPVPDAGLRESQAALSLALQLKVPPPVLLMVKACAVGLPPPCWTVKERLVGLVPMAGGTAAAVTVSGSFS
jgi:hypothetical protein